MVVWIILGLIVPQHAMHFLEHLPAFIHHFHHHHHDEKHQIGLFDLIAMHLSDTHEHSEDSEHDAHHPFRHHQGGDQHGSLIFLVSSTRSPTLFSIDAKNRQHKAATNDHIYSEFMNSIWQPPKIETETHCLA